LFSQTVEYALRAVVYLATHPDEPAATDVVAAATKVPAPYLAKIFQGLNRNGIVKSQRGIGGGILLAKPPNELTVLEVVNAVEPILRIKTCPLGITTHGTHLCPLHQRMDDALAMVEKAFGESTLAEILAEPNPSVPLCEFPGVPLGVRKTRNSE
jgi:Rrf2 family transcriptional regulator, nitric oxide-sensitive transcriptional repressor